MRAAWDPEQGLSHDRELRARSQGLGLSTPAPAAGFGALRRVVPRFWGWGDTFNLIPCPQMYLNRK